MKVFGFASDDFCKLRKLILQQIDVNMDYNEILEHCFIVGEKTEANMKELQNWLSELNSI